MSIRATTWAWEISPGIPDAKALLVLLKLADMARDSGKAWPSHKYLAEKLPLSQRSVRAAVQWLEEAGHLRKEPREGKSDVIWLNLAPTVIFAAGPEDDDDLEGGKTRGRPRKTAAENARTPDKTPAPRADEPKEPREPGSSLRASDPFEDWWALYPRRTAKGDARKAFWKAASAVAFETLMARTREYADHAKGEDPKFIPHPATWLNGERWNDELPDRSQTDGQSTRGAAQLDRGAAQHNARLEAMESGARAALAQRSRSRWKL